MSEDINDYLPETTEVEAGVKTVDRAEIMRKVREAKAAKKKAREESVKETTTKSELDTKAAELIKRRRESRVGQGPLYIPAELKDPNLHYRWEEDIDWKIGTALDAGYDFVRPTDPRWAAADLVINTGKFAEKHGEVVGRISSSQGHISYLLCMPEELWLAVHKAEADHYNAENERKRKQIDRGQYLIKDEQSYNDHS